jgi:hypothetical protein
MSDDTPLLQSVHKPSKLTHELIERICQLILTGVPSYTAAQACGIMPGVFLRWMRRGEEDLEELSEDMVTPTTPLAKLYTSVRIAQANAHAAASSAVFADEPKFWLSRGPERNAWGDKVSVSMDAQISAEVTQQPQLPATAETADDLARVFEILTEIGAIQPVTPQEKESPKVVEADKVLAPTLPARGNFPRVRR